MPFTSSLRCSTSGPDQAAVGIPSTVEVATPSPAVGLGPELSLELHQAPDSSAVSTDVGFDLGRGLVEAGQVDAEQFGAPL
jgi:hypothetical protein